MVILGNSRKVVFSEEAVHAVVPGGLIGQVVDDLPGGVFGAWHRLVLRRSHLVAYLATAVLALVEPTENLRATGRGN